MQALTTRTSASVGSTRVASGTVSMRTSPAACMMVASMWSILEDAGEGGAVMVCGRVLAVADRLEPVDDLADATLVELHFLQRDMRHGGGGSGAVPVLLARREPDDVARPDLLDRSAPALGAPDALGDEQGLAERVGVPVGAGAGLEADAGALDALRSRGVEQRVDADHTGEPVGWALAGWPAAGTEDLHGRFPFKSRLMS
jgi:hypothetical protein